MYQFSLFITASCITAYWLTVVVKSILIRSKIGKTPNIIPKEWQGAVSRLIMLPMICYWIILPWLCIYHQEAPIIPIIARIGSFSAILALGFSYYCWYYMGNSWRIGIDPKEKTEVITTGPFKYSRHPIYALSILLMLATLLTLQNLYAVLLSCTHFILFYFEALREEKYMLKTHQASYAEYISKTRRFI